ncbi:MAG TPA: hypothetical protein VFH61_15915 [Thermoleophilia bacterium]|nr:hypothetical protein [Thermoleophilia bacterium]
MTALEEYEKHRASAELTPLSAGIAALADAAIESLKCCGNCKWYAAEEFQYCDEPERHEIALRWVDPEPYYISAPDHCDFTPSRWKERV